MSEEMDIKPRLKFEDYSTARHIAALGDLRFEVLSQRRGKYMASVFKNNAKLDIVACKSFHTHDAAIYWLECEAARLLP
jgi:hypothetical protein